ncbi:hypothetical protein PCIT_a3839 [Pseudoalteromonas citrea]|uniref:Thioesterase domain-containing protein n=2 Tax=Pseudoalteromonas citrea TaxID=43655 RepID=A0AAD4AGC1_9GAMM|nr:thioesterase domain-containing protein [Pseudoalteromonas citrea]KAF7767751.1 hypothetical protein PCIT_a3839 [Pseudoalteromonas citrea]
MQSPWVVTPEKKDSKATRLLCFPYAGGGISSFWSWSKLVASNIEVNIIQNPGKGSHFKTPPIDDMEMLVTQLMPNLKEVLSGDYIIFGHSLGSRIGFEVARRALSCGLNAPKHFFVSGSGSPDKTCLKKTPRELSDREFIQQLKDIDGTPKEVLESQELMELYLPMLRADFKIAENYFFNGSDVIPCDVTVITGKEDKISFEKLMGWDRFFINTEVQFCNGGHFFIDTHQQELMQLVNRKLRMYVGFEAEHEKVGEV